MSMINFVALDLETANAYRGSICQIGITEVIDGKVQSSKSWLVKPQNNEYDEWKYTFTNLPKYNEQGKEIVYTVDEAEISKFYTKTIEGTTITNTFTVPNEKVTLIVAKVWDDNNNEKGYRPKSRIIKMKLP